MTIQKGDHQDQEIRVLVVDDHRLLRECMSHLLRLEKMTIVGAAADGLQAVALAEELQPDVILMDITLPRLSGIEATERILAAHPRIRVIGLSMHEADDFRQRMLNAGAVDYIVKGTPAHQLVARVRAALSGGET